MAEEKKKFTFFPFVEIKKDLARRRPHYISDWTDGFHSKVLSSTFFMFFTSVAPAITFAAVLNLNTVDEESGKPQIGPVEVLLSTSITGCCFALFGGQPLCIVGVTGPVTIFTLAVFNIADALDVPFLPFYCWIQIWAAIMHMVLAVVNACELIHLVTRYSCETFGMLIATIYLVTGIENLISYFNNKELEPALLSLVLGLGTAWLALLLTSARSWSIFKGWTRVLIADYGATVAVVFFCFVPYMGNNKYLTPNHLGEETNATIATLEVPDKFGPTLEGRSWFIDPSDCPVWAIFVAIIPAFILTVLFFFDHNVSSLLCQVPEFGLKKGTSYHWDFFVVGVQILLTGLLGIPPVNGLIPQAPLHTDSLCDKAFKEDEKTGKKVEIITGCHEQRVSALMQAVLIGCMLAAIKIVGYLPIATLDGLFLYMGIASFGGNTFYQRIVLWITDREKQDARSLDFLDKVPMPIIRQYTMIQLFILVCIFVITRLPFVDALFPVLIAVLVPLRLKVLPKIFGAEYVDAMDAVGEAPDAPPPPDRVASSTTDGKSKDAVVEIPSATASS